MTAAIDPRDPALNYVTVKGVRSPGRAQFSGIEAPYKWDILPGYALSGASCIFRGRDLAKPTLTIAIWKPEHFAQWALFKAALGPPTKLQPFFVEMSHPLLSSADIKAVGIESVGEPTRSPEGGLWLATIKLLEYRPWKLSLVKPDKSVPAADKGKPITPQSEIDKKLAAAAAENAALRLKIAQGAKP